MVGIAAARYGKDNVRVYKVERDAATGTQTVTEMTVCVLIEGDIDTSYTEADNSVVVTTDAMKNTVYIKAKEHPVNPPELFASYLGTHFIKQYAHIHAAHIKVITHRWTRMSFDGKPHAHSFFRDGAETRDVDVTVREGAGISIRSAINGLLVLKSTGSQFHSFLKDEYTTLQDTNDRIFSTEVSAGWKWQLPDIAAVETLGTKFNDAWEQARTITMKTFAQEDSPSVQNTMYKMTEQILAAVPEVTEVDYSLPNKHYFEIDMAWHKGYRNTGKDAEVYAPQSGPNGLIKLTVARDGAAK